MNKILGNKNFIILNESEIIFYSLNNVNQILFTFKHIYINNSKNIFKELEKFFNDNLIEIEKNIKDFIKNIYVIIDLDDSLYANIALKCNFENKIIHEKRINDFLNILRIQFIKYNRDQKIIHTIIKKILVDGKQKNVPFYNQKNKNLILEVKFECLKVETVYFIETLFSKYQISIEQFFLANYLRQSFENPTENIVQKANRSLNGENKNEVKWILKRKDKKNFFEKFFNFFG